MWLLHWSRIVAFVLQVVCGFLSFLRSNETETSKNKITGSPAVATQLCINQSAEVKTTKQQNGPRNLQNVWSWLIFICFHVSGRRSENFISLWFYPHTACVWMFLDVSACSAVIQEIEIWASSTKTVELGRWRLHKQPPEHINHLLSHRNIEKNAENQFQGQINYLSTHSGAFS